MKNLVLIGGGNQAHYTIDIIEKENKWWSETKKRIRSFSPEDYVRFKTWDVVRDIPIYLHNELFHALYMDCLLIAKKEFLY